MHNAKRVHSDRKPTFEYKVGGVAVCRETFCVAVGLRAGNSRIAKFERLIRNGCTSLPQRDERRGPKKGLKKPYGRCSQTVQFFHDYIRAHSQRSPVLPDTFVLSKNFSNKELYRRYKIQFDASERVAHNTFVNLWYHTLENKVPDPEKNTLNDVRFKRRGPVGFKICNKCCENKLKIKLAKTKIERDQALLEAQQHYDSVRMSRQTLARIRYMCRQSPGGTFVGFAIDGADTGKFQFPVTESTAKVCLCILNVIIMYYFYCSPITVTLTLN